MHMTSGAREALIETFEGLRLEPYHDLNGVLTIGYGHTSQAGAPEVTEDSVITQAQAAAILAADLARVETQVTHALQHPVTQCQFDAFCSFVYNLGIGTFLHSAMLLSFNRAYISLCATKFVLYSHAGGEVIPGLLRRREAERDWFLGKTQ